MKKIIYGLKLFLTSELNIFNQLILYIMSGDLSKFAGRWQRSCWLWK